MVRDYDFIGKKLRLVAGILFAFFTAVAVSLSAWRFWLISSFYNTATGYYDGAGISDTVMTYAVYGAVLLAVLSGLLFMKRIEIVRPVHSASSVFAGVFCGLAIAVSGVLSVIEQPLAGRGPLDWAAILLIVPVVLCFILGVTIKIGYTAGTLLNFSIILWGAVNLLRLYFDLTFTINNPAKIAQQLLYIAIMLFFVFECRSLIDKSRPAAQLAIGYVSIVICMVSVVPNILAYIIYGYELTVGFASQVAEASVLIYILIRSAVNISGICSKRMKSSKDTADIK